MRNLFRRVSVLIILVILLISASCSDENNTPGSDLELRDTLIYKKGSDIPFTGREYAKIENKIIEYDVVNGVKHGDFRLYYDSGKLEIKGTIAHNLNVGRWQYFYESGQIESEGDFVNNLPEGTWKWFYRSGNLREEGSFNKGRRLGLWKQFDEMGNITFEKEYAASDSSRADTGLMERIKRDRE